MIVKNGKIKTMRDPSKHAYKLKTFTHSTLILSIAHELDEANSDTFKLVSTNRAKFAAVTLHALSQKVYKEIYCVDLSYDLWSCL